MSTKTQRSTNLLTSLGSKGLPDSVIKRRSRRKKGDIKKSKCHEIRSLVELVFRTVSEVFEVPFRLLGSLSALRMKEETFLVDHVLQ